MMRVVMSKPELREGDIQVLLPNIVRQLPKTSVNLMPYFTRIKEMDRVGFEPTTSALFEDEIYSLSKERVGKEKYS